MNGYVLSRSLYGSPMLSWARTLLTCIAMPTSGEMAPFEILQPLSVLVIDDEPMLGTLIARLLPDCRVTVERKVRSALARIEAGEIFDRIVCDVVMPGMGGRNFFEHVERTHPHLLSRLAFMSGGALSESDERWLARLTRPLLRKPFSRQELVALLEALHE